MEILGLEIVTGQTRGRQLAGRGATLPAWEQAAILDAAERHQVDAAALAALRIAENGGPGREFGVLSVPAPTYADQLDVAARSLRNHAARFQAATGRSPRFPDGRYTDEFLRDFSARWAPLGVDNDPRGLNQYHAVNLLRAYHATELTA